MRARQRARLADQRGATAVEFAFLVPILLTLLLGIVEFGHAFQVQGTLSAAAREGARAMALRNDPAQARTAVREAAASLDPAITDAHIAIAPASCPVAVSDTDVRLTITYPMPFLTDFFGDGLELTGTGVMRCNG
ncbi:pilus assembly protein [Geodermatophilus sp. YIM 151500]|uniref:TadE/TadG family type IV pilus assembly protein n=1 Tax=Geodermatophilus sp. YIM 151500 TaxID=2984531 RepID=UPI0021E46887|nr:TadE/TadG family type IV pilus assembly protein [Geodermatophilus sp. YIM 151500]MCV2489999.1 pilus assembly protein [Geodermatophilus sp. YIM 151500]